MRAVRTAADLREALEPERAGRSRVGFVPTMGALHDGHLSLVRAARDGCDVVVVSVFVNPLQFGANEDFTGYPRDEGRDLDLAEREKIDIVFLPSVDEMYPAGTSTTVRAGSAARGLEGAARPGHFDGVCTVVAKLFNLVQPSVAFFGQKDAQQIAVIKQMVRDLAIPVEIAVCPIVRTGDGLALSSRNAYLSAGERRRATALVRALEAGRETLAGGGTIAEAEARMMRQLDATAGIEPDYAAAVDPDTFERPVPGREVLLAVAARVGRTRLIDNLVVQPHDEQLGELEEQRP